MSEIIKGFEPLIFEDSRALLLGTLPGQKSLEKGFYYADNSNYFWKFFAEYTGIRMIPSNMEDAKAILKTAKVALWDILESAERVDESGKRTSSDKDIANGKINNIEKFCKEHPNIKKIGVLGNKAFDMFQEFFPSLDAECLPSSSGANAKCWKMDRTIPRVEFDCNGYIEWSNFLSSIGNNIIEFYRFNGEFHHEKILNSKTLADTIGMKIRVFLKNGEVLTGYSDMNNDDYPLTAVHVLTAFDLDTYERNIIERKIDEIERVQAVLHSGWRWGNPMDPTFDFDLRR
ncbi:MAG: DNA-deoxyinosine glycosylase [Lachnospiraceae bacterium]|nr:DNA-deoxyinosine glycosylase [Lachnospiraceae bacterium]